MRITPLLRLLAITLLACTNLAAAVYPDRYVDVISRTVSLKHTTFCRVEKIGMSNQGRPIYAIVITDPKHPSSICSDRVRVLFMCGQHGDEPSSVYSMLALAKELCNTKDPFYRSLLSKSVIVLVPAVNPDGFAALQRLNGDGIDLNRNWEKLDQPESKAVDRLVSDFRPHVIVDMHEWLDNTSWESNGIEVASFSSERQYKLARLMARNTVSGMPPGGINMHISSYRTESKPDLAHRTFSRRGICSFLVETSQSWSPEMRRRAYKDLTISLLSTMVFPKGWQTKQMVASTMHDTRDAKEVIAAMYSPEPSPFEPTCPRAVWPMGAILSCCIILRYFTGNNRPTEAEPSSIIRTRRPALTDILRLACSPRAKTAIIRQHRHRPSDRISQKKTEEYREYVGARYG